MSYLMALRAVQHGPSEEAEIDRALDELIGKIVANGIVSLTSEERSRYESLSVRRSQLMRPSFRRFELRKSLRE